ncbi:hypothetical protein SAMN05216490_3569 [Mucilaginibacter mallensis]|uniref:Uncharacterized protein n=1 Tax=Mucilaginibacter mallensis TaxID=652787 RepID=A0A1H2AK71_MUCMA|nr:hypothetical protein [Mucilaginibacter mallensis]SDT46152.1 hypothetical protein SAMN05216490_3569 [Mucilaginibacter mallensis]
MKKILLLFFTLIIFYAQLKAQDSFILYNGDDEKALLTSAKTPDDFIKLSISSELNDGEAQIVYTKFMQEVKDLKLESISTQNNDKRLNQIYELVHKTFLKEYNPAAYFGDAIVNGQYQSTSASVLYAYVLETLGIGYQIKQYPAHVFVIAEPGTFNIKFETADKLYVIDTQTKLNEVNELIKTGYMEHSYAVNVGVERAFNDFFYSKEDVTFKEAVGLLYYNRALQEMQGEQFNSAYSDICKSDILFPDKKNAFLKHILMTSMIGNLKYDDLKDWQALTQLANEKNASDEVKNLLAGQFNNTINIKLLNEGKKDKVDAIFNYLNANIIDSALKTDIREKYYYNNAHYSYILNNYTEAFGYAEQAYVINPNNPLLTSSFIDMLIQKLNEQNGTPQNITLLNIYSTKYPLLQKNARFNALYIYNYAYLSSKGFATQDGITGEKYLKLLTDKLATYTEHTNNSDMQISNAFSQASMYYFRKSQKQKAIALLKTGLKYVPDSDILLRKLQADTQ